MSCDLEIFSFLWLLLPYILNGWHVERMELSEIILHHLHQASHCIHSPNQVWLGWLSLQIGSLHVDSSLGGGGVWDGIGWEISILHRFPRIVDVQETSLEDTYFPLLCISLIAWKSTDFFSTTLCCQALVEMTSIFSIGIASWTFPMAQPISQTVFVASV